jgi:hypothetical protein
MKTLYQKLDLYFGTMFLTNQTSKLATLRAFS